MSGDANHRPVGICSVCGGIVSVPVVFEGGGRPLPQCEKCGGLGSQHVGLPMVTVAPILDREDGEETDSFVDRLIKEKDRVEKGGEAPEAKAVQQHGEDGDQVVPGEAEPGQ